MGRRSRPTHLKVLSGERESRINRGEPTPAEAAIAPPAELGDAARKIWQRLAPDLEDKGCLTSWDVDMFAAFCQAVATYYECLERMGTNPTVPGSTKNEVPSPYWRIMRDCIETMTRIGGRFGLTPSDRAGIDVAETADKPKCGPERLLT
jgi:P27 family predicted phage terminase small subunit